MKLTAKQTSFAEYYADPASESYNNATQSAIKAGYSKKTAYSIGVENLNKPVIIKAVKAFKAKISKKIEISREYLIEKLQSVIDDPDKKGDIIAASRVIAEICGFNREAAENPENIKNKQKLNKEQTDLIRKLAKELTENQAQQPEIDQNPPLKIRYTNSGA